MSEPLAERLTVGDGAEAREIAVLHAAGAAPGLFWLGGFRSDMTGTKASGARRLGRRATASPPPASTIPATAPRAATSPRARSRRWLEEARAVFDRLL